MNGHSEANYYSFKDCVVSSDQQLLRRSGREIRLGTKLYYLLLTFVKNPGLVLSKDEIIESVWPGQIVTDAALAKQILRLRKVIGDDDAQRPLIDTHRGIGYMFTAPVQMSSSSNKDPVPGQESRPALPRTGLKLLAVGLAVVVLALWITQFPFDHQKDTPPQSLEKKVVNVALVPSAGVQTALNRGSIEYLSNLLTQQESINTISPDEAWFESDSPEKLAIELTSNRNIQYSCLINLGEDQGQYFADIKLRTADEVVAGELLHATSVPALIDLANDWITIKLSAHGNLQMTGREVHGTGDAFALESYLQGVFVSESGGNVQAASEYFQASVNKDPMFAAAWAKLAGAHMQLGNFDKAIAIANTILARDEVRAQPRLVTELNFVIAMSYYHLRDLDKTKASIERSLDAIQSSDDPQLKMSGLASLALLAEAQEDWDSAIQRTHERLALSKEYYPLPGYIADIHLQLAKYLEKTFAFDEMRAQLEEALQYYEVARDNKGMLAGFTILMERDLNQNLFDEGIVLALRAEPFLGDESAVHEQVLFFQVAAYLHNLRGLFSRSNEYVARMRQIAQKTNNRRYLLMADYIKLHMAFLQKDYDYAKTYLASMYASFANDSFMPSNMPFVRTLDLLLSG
ncbi:MAG: winged helix-turn-helix domain-containing protein, partial [Lysobacterales bacterium]